MVEITGDILKKCIENDRIAQKKLYEYCFHHWIGMCRRYHTNYDDARSSLNIAFLKIIENLSKIELESLKFDAWARRIISNTLIDEYRKNHRLDKNIQLFETDRELEYFADNELNEGLDKMNHEFLLGLLERLPDGARLVFNLYVIEGYSHQEISEKLGIPLGTSKWQLSNAKKLLKDLLEQLFDKNTLYEVYRS